MADNPDKVVTRFQYSSLFSKAWYLSIQPHMFVSGFHRVSVYPFDSNAIKPYGNKTPPETPTVTPTEVTPAVTQHTEDLSAPQDLSGESTLEVSASGILSPISFSEEQIELF